MSKALEINVMAFMTGVCGRIRNKEAGFRKESVRQTQLRQYAHRRVSG